jgi:hypothetical protein
MAVQRKGAPRQFSGVKGILETIPVLSLDIPADAAYPCIRAELEAAGESIGMDDLLTAAAPDHRAVPTKDLPCPSSVGTVSLGYTLPSGPAPRESASGVTARSGDSAGRAMERDSSDRLLRDQGKGTPGCIKPSGMSG